MHHNSSAQIELSCDKVVIESQDLKRFEVPQLSFHNFSCVRLFVSPARELSFLFRHGRDLQAGVADRNNGAMAV